MDVGLVRDDLLVEMIGIDLLLSVCYQNVSILGRGIA